jgi:hypothetical protein
MNLSEILIICIAAGVNMAIGALWYSSYLFGNRWFFLSGFDMDNPLHIEQMRNGAKTSYGIAAVNSLVIAFVLWYILYKGAVTLASDAIFVAMFLWVGFVVTTSLTNTLFSRRTKELWAIDVGYHGAGLVAMSIVLTAFF